MMVFQDYILWRIKAYDKTQLMNHAEELGFATLSSFLRFVFSNEKIMMAIKEEVRRCKDKTYWNIKRVRWR